MRHARNEDFCNCRNFAFKKMTETLYFSISSESVSNHNCLTCLLFVRVCVKIFLRLQWPLQCHIEICELGRVSWQQWISGIWKNLWVIKRLNFLTFFIKNILFIFSWKIFRNAVQHQGMFVLPKFGSFRGRTSVPLKISENWVICKTLASFSNTVSHLFFATF